MQNWSKGLELELHVVGSYGTVKSTEDAARRLLANWPTGKAKAYIDAQEACLSTLEGVTSPELARGLSYVSAVLTARHSGRDRFRGQRRAARRSASAIAATLVLNGPISCSTISGSQFARNHHPPGR